MKIGEVRVAEDSDFALLKVFILFIVVTIVIFILSIIMIATALKLRKGIKKCSTENGYFLNSLSILVLLSQYIWTNFDPLIRPFMYTGSTGCDV